MWSAEKFGAVTGEGRAPAFPPRISHNPTCHACPNKNSILVGVEHMVAPLLPALFRSFLAKGRLSTVRISNRHCFRIEMPVTCTKQGTGNFLIVTENATFHTRAQGKPSPTPRISNREPGLLESGLSHSKQTTAALPNRELSTVLRRLISDNSASPQHEKESGSPDAPEQSKIAAKKSYRERRGPA